MSVSKNTISRSAPLQNLSVCASCDVNPVLQFRSASEVAEYRKRKVTSAYYSAPTNVFPIKNRYTSIFTTFKKAETVVSPFADATCCGTGLTALSSGKDTPSSLYNKFNPT